MKDNKIDHSKLPVKFEYDLIDENIIIGTNMCCQIHFDEGLIKKGIDTDISMEEEKVDAPYGVRFFLWLPTKDKTAPTEEHLEVGVNFMDDLIRRGRKIYVHCRNGHGRGPALVIAYYISKGMDTDAAIRLVKSKRPAIHLEDSQICALRKFEKKRRI